MLITKNTVRKIITEELQKLLEADEPSVADLEAWRKKRDRANDKEYGNYRSYARQDEEGYADLIIDFTKKIAGEWRKIYDENRKEMDRLYPMNARSIKDESGTPLIGDAVKPYIIKKRLEMIKPTYRKMTELLDSKLRGMGNDVLANFFAKQMRAPYANYYDEKIDRRTQVKDAFVDQWMSKAADKSEAMQNRALDYFDMFHRYMLDTISHQRMGAAFKVNKPGEREFEKTKPPPRAIPKGPARGPTGPGSWADEKSI